MRYPQVLCYHPPRKLLRHVGNQSGALQVLLTVVPKSIKDEMEKVNKYQESLEGLQSDGAPDGHSGALPAGTGLPSSEQTFVPCGQSEWSNSSSSERSSESEKDEHLEELSSDDPSHKTGLSTIYEMEKLDKHEDLLGGLHSDGPRAGHSGALPAGTGLPSPEQTFVPCGQSEWSNSSSSERSSESEKDERLEELSYEDTSHKSGLSTIYEETASQLAELASDTSSVSSGFENLMAGRVCELLPAGTGLPSPEQTFVPCGQSEWSNSSSSERSSESEKDERLEELSSEDSSHKSGLSTIYEETASQLAEVASDTSSVSSGFENLMAGRVCELLPAGTGLPSPEQTFVPCGQSEWSNSSSSERSSESEKDELLEELSSEDPSHKSGLSTIYEETASQLAELASDTSSVSSGFENLKAGRVCELLPAGTGLPSPEQTFVPCGQSEWSNSSSSERSSESEKDELLKEFSSEDLSHKSGLSTIYEETASQLAEVASDTSSVSSGFENLLAGRVCELGTPETLINNLIEVESKSDATYIEDFLLMCRTFLPSQSIVVQKLLQWFEISSLREKVARIVLLWVYNHFIDFEKSPEMSAFLEHFDNLLEIAEMKGHLQMLRLACTTRAKPRHIRIHKPSRESSLGVTLVGGRDTGFGIFVLSVNSCTLAAEAGLKRGDQIMEINDMSIENMTYEKVVGILEQHTKVSITVKNNILVFKELLRKIEQENNAGVPYVPTTVPCNEVIVPKETTNRRQSNTVFGVRNLIRSIFGVRSPRVAPLPSGDDEVTAGAHTSMQLPSSLQQSTTSMTQSTTPKDIPDTILQIYNADQKSCFVKVSKDSTAEEVVSHALSEFCMKEAADRYSLCKISVHKDGSVRQRSLKDHVSKLADRVQLNDRYYLKENVDHGMLCTDDGAQSLLRDSEISLLELSPMEVARQLFARDFSLFSNLEPSDYVTDIFQLGSKTSNICLTNLERLTEEETYWVSSEILKEKNENKRMRLVKMFIKIALHCRTFKNFNSMFAIISGLNLAPVARLSNTFKKLPSKYKRLLKELNELVHCSQKITTYREVLGSESMEHPTIPFFPLIKNHLTSLLEENESKADGMIHFDQLRIIAAEIRNIISMTFTNTDPAEMFRQRTHGVMDIKGRASRKQLKMLYKEAQMERMVKHYLSNIKVQTNLKTLDIMSWLCDQASRTSPETSKKSLRVPYNIKVEDSFRSDLPTALQVAHAAFITNINLNTLV